MAGIVGATALLAAQVFPQQATYQGILSGTELPSTIVAADIKSEWKAVRIGLSQGSSGGIFDMLMSMMGGMFSSLGSGGGGGNEGLQIMSVAGLSWSSGATMKVGDQEFLVTYRLDMDAALISSPEKTPDFSKVPLRLTLVNTKSITSLSPLPEMTKDRYLELLKKMSEQPREGQPTSPSTPPEPTEDQAMPARPSTEEDRTAGVQNAKHLALAMVMYAADYDEVFPYAQGTATAKYVTYPYLKSPGSWDTNNPNGTKFLMSMAVAGVELGKIEDPADVVLYYESGVWDDGRRIVVFVDGHVVRADGPAWESAKKSLQLKFPRVGKPLPRDYGIQELRNMGIEPR